jgi:prepilin-type N-terminal cleavage/methylation domain-containing protein
MYQSCRIIYAENLGENPVIRVWKSMKRRDRGLSMVEVMIAAAIMAVVLLAFMSMMHSSSTLSATARDTTVAAGIIQSTSETLFAMGYQQFWDTYFGNNPNGIYFKIVQGGDQDKTAYYEPNPKVVDDVKRGYYFPFTSTGRLRNETIWLIMLPSSDRASTSMTWSDHAWVDFKILVTWEDSRGKTREEYIITRRSQ